jgi:gluconate kinase
MKTGMLKSQFDALEEPGAGEATICDAGQSVMAIVAQIIAANFDSIHSK